jgi:hypothetical protein
MDIIAWKTGDITPEIFRRYLKKCIIKKVLIRKKDRYGRTWYSGPE